MTEARLLLAGSATYADEHWPNLPVAEAMEIVKKSLGQFVTAVDTISDENGCVETVSAKRVKEAFQKWFVDEDADRTATILYLVGHGARIDPGVPENSARFALVMHDSPESEFLDHNCVRIGDLFDYLRNWDKEPRFSSEMTTPWTFVIIDACAGGVGVAELRRLNGTVGHSDQSNLGAWSVGSGATTALAIPRAIQTFVETLGPDDQEIGIRELARGVDLALNPEEDRSVSSSTVDFLFGGSFKLINRAATGGLSGTVESLTQLEALLADVRKERPAVVTHFLTKAQGTEIDERAWHFEGRATETSELVAWLNDPGSSGIRIVTGAAGTGKSAFLGRLVIFAEQDLREALVTAAVLESPDPGLVPERPFDAVLHLTGWTLAESIGRLAEILELDAEPNVEDLADALTERCGRGEVFTILVDALDEALDPYSISESLLRRIARIPGVKVLVGTRRSLNEDPDRPAHDTTGRTLLSALGVQADSPSIVALGVDSGAVQRYAERRLRWESSISEAEAADLAQRIAARAQPFLFARLATTELRARPDMGENSIHELLSGNHRAIFKVALDRFDEHAPHVVPLLRTLAYALGRGFPRRWQIWADVAENLHHDLRVSDADIDDALAVAGAYIVRDAERGEDGYTYTVFRLAHRTFAEYFLAEAEQSTPS